MTLEGISISGCWIEVHFLKWICFLIPGQRHGHVEWYTDIEINDDESVSPTCSAHKHLYNQIIVHFGSNLYVSKFEAQSWNVLRFLLPLLRSYLHKKYSMLHTSLHYNDVIMSAMASQITSLAIVYPTIYTGADKKKTSKLRVTGLSAGNSPVTGKFPAQWPATLKIFPFDDVIMCYHQWSLWWNAVTQHADWIFKFTYLTHCDLVTAYSDIDLD